MFSCCNKKLDEMLEVKMKAEGWTREDADNLFKWITGKFDESESSVPKCPKDHASERVRMRTPSATPRAERRRPVLLPVLDVKMKAEGLTKKDYDDF
eukprot:4477377-Prymnesium_polylepis.1